MTLGIHELAPAADPSLEMATQQNSVLCGRPIDVIDMRVVECINDGHGLPGGIVQNIIGYMYAILRCTCVLGVKENI